MTRKEDTSSDNMLYPNSPRTNAETNDYEKDGDASDEYAVSPRKQPKISSVVDAPLTSTPDSTSSNHSISTNVISFGLQSKVCFLLIFQIRCHLVMS